MSPFTIEGIATTIAMHLTILRSADFRAGSYDNRRLPGWTT